MSESIPALRDTPSAFIVVCPSGSRMEAGYGSRQECKGPGCFTTAMVNGTDFDQWFCSRACFHRAAQAYVRVYGLE